MMNREVSTVSPAHARTSVVNRAPLLRDCLWHTRSVTVRGTAVNAARASAERVMPQFVMQRATAGAERAVQCGCAPGACLMYRNLLRQSALDTISTHRMRSSAWYMFASKGTRMRLAQRVSLAHMPIVVPMDCEALMD